ncbi:TetR-like C-terminal domain-containing protein [Arthrobacter sp. H20]|uniref:TetR/AcrR family transcriptional regulator n=1 Tax=Arthrobacter sp. H20 TaxID=1267981 RepID=UPI00047BCF4A|nr:TetR-like C-terminal domain-containing protein [Arthrobacter sp. H20]
MPRAGLDRAAVIDRAATLLDDRTSSGLNLAVLAESLGVRTPSLYKHIEGMPGLQRGIMLRAKAEFCHTLGQAAIGRSREDAITGMSHAYRQWALDHPGQYPLTVRAPAPDDEEDCEVSAATVTVIFSVLAGYHLTGDDAVDATRFLRSALHGFVALETGGAFELPASRQRSFERVVTSVVTALSNWTN